MNRGQIKEFPSPSTFRCRCLYVRLFFSTFLRRIIAVLLFVFINTVLTKYPFVVTQCQQKIGDFCLPAEQAAHIGNAEDNSGAAAPKASLSSSFLPFEAHKESSQKEVGAGMEDQRQQSGKTHRLMDSCIGTARSSHQSYSFRRSSMCSSCSTVPSSTLDKDSGRSSSRPYSRCSGYSDSSHRDRVGSEGRIGRQTTHPTSPARIDDASFVGHMSRHSDCSSSRREERLRLRLFKDDEARQQQQSLYQGSSSTHRFGRHIDLDPAFDRHHRYDLIAHLRAEEGKEVTGRFGPVNANSVMAASSLTSKLSLPWSHKLRGQK